MNKPDLRYRNFTLHGLFLLLFPLFCNCQEGVHKRKDRVENTGSFLIKEAKWHCSWPVIKLMTISKHQVRLSKLLGKLEHLYHSFKSCMQCAFLG
jgi:hypothetical protein